MKPFCEIIVADVLPAVRALITKELMDAYGFNQSKTSAKLGITQPAISQYRRELRGNRVKKLQKSPVVMKLIKKLSSDIANDKINPIEMNKRFCKICEVVRKEKIICKIHEHSYPSIESCDICLK